MRVCQWAVISSPSPLWLVLVRQLPLWASSYQSIPLLIWWRLPRTYGRTPVYVLWQTRIWAIELSCKVNDRKSNVNSSSSRYFFLFISNLLHVLSEVFINFALVNWNGHRSVSDIPYLLRARCFTRCTRKFETCSSLRLTITRKSKSKPKPRTSQKERYFLIINRK